MFTIFKMLQFYPSIKRHLLKKAISFPKKYVSQKKRIPQKKRDKFSLYKNIIMSHYNFNYSSEKRKTKTI